MADWPKKLGFAEEPVKAMLPIGTPYEQRALSPGSKSEKYYEYEVIKPLPVIQGKVVPAFGETGGGVQILPNMKDRVDVKWLIDNKYIKEVDANVINSK